MASASVLDGHPETTELPLPPTAFTTLALPPDLLANVQSLGYTEMTPIQAQSLPPILAGKDVIGQAKTGSGKTAAFGLGLLAHLNTEVLQVQSLVLCPTRELADQVAKALRALARTMLNVKILTVSGGMPYRPQVRSLEHGAHIVVGTPGRVAKHLRKENMTLTSLTRLVLDEGDRMLDMGFQEELDQILEYVPARRQTLLFSATYPPQIHALAGRIMQEPVMIKVDSAHDEESIQQVLYKVEKEDDRLQALQRILLQDQPGSTVVFCNTKLDVDTVCRSLQRAGFSALALHGDLEQRERDETLVRFSNKSVSVLVATDVAARGLDIEALDAVINYHIPRDFEVHVHRIGRTGRAGSQGIACSLFSDKEHHKISELQKFLGRTIPQKPLPVPKHKKVMTAPMATIKIKIGKKNKFRPGNILGALTGTHGLSADQVGKIHIFDQWSTVAVARSCVKQAIKKLSGEKWRDRPIQGWEMR